MYTVLTAALQAENLIVPERKLIVPGRKLIVPERKLWTPGIPKDWKQWSLPPTETGKKPKVLVLFCGGTIAMRRNAQGAMEPALTPNELFKLAPRVRDHADVNIHFITGKDSSALTFSDRKKILASIRKNMNDYDAIVVTHGTDTMATTASTLALALGGSLKVPVVLTGSQMAPEDFACDATPNLERAFYTATTAPQPGVYLAFHDHVHAGLLSAKRSESALAAFHSPASEPVGTFTAHGLEWNESMLRRVRSPPGPVLPYGNPHVSTILLEGDLPVSELKRVIKQEIRAKKRGLVVLAPGTGNISEQHLKELEKAVKNGMSVVFGSQITGGKIQAGSYELGRAAQAAGMVPANDMTPYAAKTKTIWALGILDVLEKKGQLKPADRQKLLARLFLHNRAGEMTLPAGQGHTTLPEMVTRLDREYGNEDRVKFGRW